MNPDSPHLHEESAAASAGQPGGNGASGPSVLVGPPALDQHTPLLALLEQGLASEQGGSSVEASALAGKAVDFASRGYHVEMTVAPERVVLAAQLMDSSGFALDTITGVDWLAEGQMELLYDYFHPESPTRVLVRCRVPRVAPEAPTISAVFPGANWHERETHEFLGIRFQGHPNLTPFLLPEDADYHPLRKDYAA
jgi:NADH-quinone oxidoreductase subunit C